MMQSRHEVRREAARVCMVTPHLPPEQAANALLPPVVAAELATAGIACSFVSHPPATALSAGPHDHPVTYVARRGRGWFDRTPIGAAIAAARMAFGARRPIADADLVHLHSNGFIVEVAGRLAARRSVPCVVTLYGTDVWHHDATRNRRFAEVVRAAAHRVFYSRALLQFARPLGLAEEPASVIYAPVAPSFHRAADDGERVRLRRQLGAGAGPILVTVKRLHPVAGHEDLLRALPEVVRAFPEASLWLVGDGPLRSSLEALAHELDVASHVRFLGALPNEALWPYLAAADCFVLPSRLESWGTVMLEALACGTPVVATDTAGGQEVRSCFPDDVELCEKENPGSLAAGVLAALRVSRRTSDATARTLRDRFSPAACAAQYQTVYEDVLRPSQRSWQHGA